MLAVSAVLHAGLDIEPAWSHHVAVAAAWAARAAVMDPQLDLT
jgi:hypothetical protein